jgi:hypothetical protein
MVPNRLILIENLYPRSVYLWLGDINKLYLIMGSLKFEVLEAKTMINNNQYPMYTGFLPAELLIKIAEVPSFSVSKPHHRIADDVIKPPIDEWQRPEDLSKIQTIKEIYGDTTKDNLMANPVLLGTAIQNLNPPKISIIITQKTVRASNGEVIPIPKLYEVEINYDQNLSKPIWILDGQHRIKGLSISSQKNELVPFVLLHDTSKYTPPFLAEIFTHVTTGAKPMEPIHGEWMKFAFDLEHYKQKAHKFAMETTIFLCKESTLGGLANPFNNQIQFNPYILPAPKWNAFGFDSIEWERIIATNFYGKGGKLPPKEIAEEIVKATLAFEKQDTHKSVDSKIFSTNNSHKILAEAYLIGLLVYLVQVNKQTSFIDWESFFLDPRRAVNKCNFSLPFVKTTGALSSNNGKPSKEIAIDSFTDFFCSPNELNGQILTDFLQGIGGNIKMSAYKSNSGRIDKKTKIEKIIPFGSGVTPFDLSAGDISRDIISIENISSNIYINSVRDLNHRPAHELKKALTKKGENISSFPDHYEIDIEYMAYSGDSKKVTQIRLDK